jgi:hypothetical protein
MKVLEVHPDEFTKNIQPYQVYGSSAFSVLNASKAEEICHLLFTDGEVRFGLTGGIRHNSFLSPFSAPFGGFVYHKEAQRISHLDEACQALVEWGRSRQLSSIEITLPPDIYHSSFVAKQINALHRGGFTIQDVDLNYSFRTERLDANYPETLWHNARKNLRIGTNNQLNFHPCTSQQEKQQAYDVIQANREAKNFTLSLSWNQLEASTRLIPADFFLCTDAAGTAIASTIAFHVSEGIVQVIYWGDIPTYSALKSMNFMSFKVFEHYRDNGIRIVDIGPSTQHSVPFYGVCDFKESIGCDISTKITLTQRLNT